MTYEMTVFRMRGSIYGKVLVVFAILVVLLFVLPGPIEGNYTVAGFSTSGAHFLHLGNGVACVLFEDENQPKYVGRYALQEDIGCVLQLKSGTGTVPFRISSRLLFLQFESLADGTREIIWRYPRFLKARHVVQQHAKAIAELEKTVMRSAEATVPTNANKGNIN